MAVSPPFFFFAVISLLKTVMLQSLCLLWGIFWVLQTLLLFWGSIHYTIFLSRLHKKMLPHESLSYFLTWITSDRCLPFSCSLLPCDRDKHYTLLRFCAGVWTGTLHCISLNKKKFFCFSWFIPFFYEHFFFYLNSVYERWPLAQKIST